MTSLVNAALLLLSNSTLRGLIAANARLLVQRHYTAALSAKRYRDLYHELSEMYATEYFL